jgi:hypothetical protein
MNANNIRTPEDIQRHKSLVTLVSYGTVGVGILFLAGGVLSFFGSSESSSSSEPYLQPHPGFPHRLPSPVTSPASVDGAAADRAAAGGG